MPEKPGDSIIRELYPNDPMGNILIRLKEATGKDWRPTQINDRARKLDVQRNREQSIPPAGGDLYEIPRITAERVIIASDLHVPFHNRAMITRLLDLGEALGVQTLVIIGDLFDNWVFSRFEHRTREIPWKEERKAADAIIGQMLKVFSDIHIIPGNHDVRILRQLQFQITFPDLCQLLESGKHVKEYLYPRILLNNNSILVHPGSYSRRPAAVPIELVGKYRKDVYMGHTHVQALAWDPSGQNLAVEVGCLVDQARTDYKNLDVTTHPEWIPGFVAVLNGETFLFNERTNWSRWIKKELP